MLYEDSEKMSHLNTKLDISVQQEENISQARAIIILYVYLDFPQGWLLSSYNECPNNCQILILCKIKQAMCHGTSLYMYDGGELNIPFNGINILEF